MSETIGDLDSTKMKILKEVEEMIFNSKNTTGDRLNACCIWNGMQKEIKLEHITQDPNFDDNTKNFYRSFLSGSGSNECKGGGGGM